MSKPRQQSATTRDQGSSSAVRSGSLIIALVIGVPLGVATIAFMRQPMFEGTMVKRYASHPVECVEIVMFCCALGILVTKWWGRMWQRRALRQTVLPAWDGTPTTPAAADALLREVGRLPRATRNSWVGRRAANVLDFLCRRRSAAELDDHVRTVSDTDSIALENSYSFLRLIIWSVPILGFLGTVLGITEAIAGVSPEKLENDISGVTEGLAVAFDTTGLALALTMVLMFFTSTTERVEQRVLEDVDSFVDLHLAHRFVRPEGDTGPFVAALEQQSSVLLSATDEVVRRQADVWAKTLDAAERRWAEAEERQHAKLASSLEAALERTEASHEARLDALRRQTEASTAGLLPPLIAMTEALRQHHEGQQALLQQLDVFAAALGRLHEDEGRLGALQQLLQQNLAAVTSTGSFEEAVHSLTAAVHLLTAKTTTGSGWRRGGEAA